jgi:hypothetical protein
MPTFVTLVPYKANVDRENSGLRGKEEGIEFVYQ